MKTPSGKTNSGRLKYEHYCRAQNYVHTIYFHEDLMWVDPRNTTNNIIGVFRIQYCPFCGKSHEQITKEDSEDDEEESGR